MFGHLSIFLCPLLGPDRLARLAIASSAGCMSKCHGGAGMALSRTSTSDQGSAASQHSVQSVNSVGSQGRLSTSTHC